MNADADEEVDEREHGADSPARPSSNAKKGPSGRQNGNSHDQHETKNPDGECTRFASPWFVNILLQKHDVSCFV
jgi:hypothetical protein